ncbi:hypothetical protein IMZ48_11575, partial [Candidatus Bathyarchaeota archaeon]|nr:hypothetical protein [Candidatus Bathyarchaeota archaeon]
MMNRAIFCLPPGHASGRVSTRMTPLLSRTPGTGSLPRRLFSTSNYLREKFCAKVKEGAPKDTA